MIAADTECSDAELPDFKLRSHAFMKSFVENSVESCCDFMFVTAADLAKHFHVNLLDESIGETFPDGFIPNERAELFGRSALLLSNAFHLIA